MRPLVTAALTAAAMLAFAGNSLLTRAALAAGGIDALSFTVLRLLAGALVLLALRRARPVWRDGSWASAAALFCYAIGFSLAYLRLAAATGALILFASVQAGMIGWGLWRGQRPGPRASLGLAIAFAAFTALLLPGLQAPDPLGAALMATAGLAWAVYSLRGGGGSALARTAGNFQRAAVLSLPLALVALATGHAEAHGVVLALLSGGVTSGIGYAIWYRALPGLTPLQAATVQLTVPLIAALGGVVLLSESLTTRLVLSGLCLLGGVALTITAPRRS
jgi:drug/metabolite transporter (DMT)-like permease